MTNLVRTQAPAIQSDFGEKPILFGLVPGLDHIGVIATAGAMSSIVAITVCGGLLPALPILAGLLVGTSNDLTWKCRKEMREDYGDDEPATVEIESEEITEPLAVERVDYADQPEFREANPWDGSAKSSSTATENPRFVPVPDVRFEPVAPSVISFEVEQELECYAAGITPDEYRAVLESLPASLGTPKPSQVAVLLGRPPASATAPARIESTAKPLAKPGGLAVAPPVPTPVECRFEGVVETTGGEGGFVDIEAINEVKEQIRRTYKNGCDLSETSHLAKGSAYYLLRSCYELDPDETVFSQNWLINNAFKISKGSKSHQYFRNVRSRVRQDMELS